MSKFTIDGPRTFVRVSDENGNLIAYVGGSSLQEANRLARDITRIEEFRQEAREIYQQSHNDEELDTGDALQFIGRIAGVKEGWKPVDTEETCRHYEGVPGQEGQQCEACRDGETEVVTERDLREAHEDDMRKLRKEEPELFEE